MPRTRQPRRPHQPGRARRPRAPGHNARPSGSSRQPPHPRRGQPPHPPMLRQSRELDLGSASGATYAEYELLKLRCQRGLSRTDRPVPGVAPAILWLHACGEGAKRSRLSSSGGPVSQRICVPTRQTATRHAHAAGSRADHPTSPAPPPHHGYLRDPRISQQVPARVLDRPRVPGASCRASTTSPKPPEASGSSSVYSGNGPLSHVRLLAAVYRRVTRLLTTVSSRIGCACFRVAALGRGWSAVGGVW